MSLDRDINLLQYFYKPENKISTSLVHVYVFT